MEGFNHGYAAPAQSNVREDGQLSIVGTGLTEAVPLSLMTVAQGESSAVR
jgi:hypothetical protein